ncbi:MAG: Type 1 glutamine amidotransferase-like domain-containing protein [Lentimicrobium sp.]|nr:Type 1 glutamine amidotransferase-like domain-containing protein [Lentimicrobium sp.]
MVHFITSRIVLTGLVFLFISFNTFAQGRLLLVGGGNEKNGANSWSVPAYRWAAEGKKVAIVGISTGSLAPYLTSQCGASAAKEFAIDSRQQADSQATYDTLMAYDVIFFRGGDQWDYYDFYPGTRLQDAVNDKFAQGGCIAGTSAGMHILSGVVYTAENGTVYSYEAIENPNNQYVTLEDDFFGFMPGFVFDTHFAERARFGRLAGFLANYKFTHNQDIIGLGMDDMTCMTVDETGLGTVYGTGCANFYSSKGSFTQNGYKLLADSVQVVQLLKGCTYNFITGEFTYASLDRNINTWGQTENGNFTVLASGSDLLTYNMDMITDLVTDCGNPAAGVLIFSGDNTLAESFKAKILEAGASAADIINPTSALGNDTGLADHIRTASKILFLKNAESSFMPFMHTANGNLLVQKLQSDGMISAFAGADARLAGKTVVSNYLTYLASWYGELTFEPGLGLLKHTVVMPQTFFDSDIYENTATAIPYAMALDTLKFGIWLTKHNYMKLTPVDGKATLTGYGTAPVMVLANEGTLTGFSTQTSTGTSGTPRMVAGFEKLRLDLIDETTPYVMGQVSPAGMDEMDGNPATIRVFPNPAGESLSVHRVANAKTWMILGVDGKTINQGSISCDQLAINIKGITPGIYFLHLCGINRNTIAVARFIKN